MMKFPKNWLCLVAMISFLTGSSAGASTVGAMYKSCKPLQTAGFPETFQLDNETGILSYSCYMYFRSLSDIAFGLCLDKSFGELRGETPPDHVTSCAFEAKVPPLVTAFCLSQNKTPTSGTNSLDLLQNTSVAI
jgi:hypothetical protein